jgi:hypothetical protein
MGGMKGSGPDGAPTEEELRQFAHAQEAKKKQTEDDDDDGPTIEEVE